MALERGPAPIGRDNRLPGCPDGSPEIHVVYVLTGDLVDRAVEPFEELYSIRGKYRREPRDANFLAVGDQAREPLARGLGFRVQLPQGTSRPRTRGYRRCIMVAHLLWRVTLELDRIGPTHQRPFDQLPCALHAAHVVAGDFRHHGHRTLRQSIPAQSLSIHAIISSIPEPTTSPAASTRTAGKSTSTSATRATGTYTGFGGRTTIIGVGRGRTVILP